MAPAAARRAAAAAVRYVVAAPPRAAIHRAGTPAAIHPAGRRAAAIHPAGRRAAAIHRAGRRVAAIHHAPYSSVATPPSSVAVGSSATPSSSVAIHSPSSFVSARSGATPPSHAPTFVAATGNLATATGRFGRRSLCTRVALHPFKKIQRRFNHTERTRKGAMPEEVKAELKRIEAEGVNRHKELQQSILNLSKQVADATANAQSNKVDSTWLMGKTAWKVCSTVLATAAVSGYVVLNFIKFGWARESQDTAGSMLESKISALKEELDKSVERLLEENQKEEVKSLAHKESKLNEKAQLLDKKEAELEKREAAVAAKEAATKKPPKN